MRHESPHPNLKLSLELRPSNYLFQLITLLHLGAVLAINLLALPWITWGLLVVIILVSYFNLLRKFILRTSKTSIVALWENDNGSWQLKFKNNQAVTAWIKPASCVIMQYLLVLKFKVSGGLTSPSYTVIILPDSLDKSIFQQLKYYLLRIKRE